MNPATGLISDIAMGYAPLREGPTKVAGRSRGSETVSALGLENAGLAPGALERPGHLPARNVEATTGIEPVYAVLQSPPERAPASASVRPSCSIRPLRRRSVRRRCYRPSEIQPQKRLRHVLAENLSLRCHQWSTCGWRLSASAM